MKQPQPNINKIAVDTFVAKTGANRKLKRLWGTTTVNGVEVLNLRRHYHKESYRPDNYERLFKFLTVYNDVKDYEGGGIKSAWFTLSKSKGPENLDVNPSFISDNLNSMWWDSDDGVMPNNLTLTTSITISESFRDTDTLTGIDWSLSKEDTASYILNNYEELWDNKKIEQEGVGIINKGSVVDPTLKVEIPDKDDLSPDDPWLAILSRYALRDSGVPCTIKNIEVGLGINSANVYNTVVVTIEIPYFEFLTSTPLVQKILSDLSMDSVFKYPVRARGSVHNGFVNNNEQLTKSQARKVNYYETADDIDVDTISRSYIQWEYATIQSSVYESFWYQDGDKWYLRADVIDNPKAYGTTHGDLNSYLFSLLDTGYKKKKVPLWKKVVAAVVFIIAVIITFIYPPSAAATKPFMAAALAVLTGSLVVTLAMVAFSAIGMNEWAMAFASVSKAIEPLVTVASIVMVVGSVYTAATKAAETAALEGVKSGLSAEATATVASEALKESLTTTIIDSIVTSITGTSLTSVMAGSFSIVQVLSVSTKAVSMYTNVQIKKLDNINDENKDLRAEYEKLAEESAMDSDIMMGYMNIYAKPATADWSIYASTYDLPYERGGGSLSMGNIQKTTKQAMRKTDYNDPMFESMGLA
jgi:hypothetical protein